MANNEQFFTNLNNVFNNTNALLDYVTSIKTFYETRYNYALASALKYYITIRDTTFLDFYNIDKRYSTITNWVVNGWIKDNVITNGFLTHSFNGIERQYIEKYGFNYLEQLSSEEAKTIRNNYKKINILEKALDKNDYVIHREENNQKYNSQEIFFTFPGAKSIYYASIAPERLYMGPISNEIFKEFPIVVGESKKEYLLRNIRYKLSFRKYMDDSEEYYLKVASSLLDDYTKYKPNISFININDCRKNPFSEVIFDPEDTDLLELIINDMTNRDDNIVDNMFTKYFSDQLEGYVGNLVTLTTYLTNIKPHIIAMPDSYNLKQEFLRSLGYPQGTLVDYNSCKKIDNIENENIKKLYKDITG